MHIRKMLGHALLMLAVCCVAWTLFPSDIFASSTDTSILQASDESAVLDSLTNDDRFEILVLGLRQTGLADDLETDGRFTLFAPTDYAFDSLPESELNALLADPDVLWTTLIHHILAGKLTSYELAQTGSATTQLGTSLTFIQHGDELMVDGAIVERGQIEASNGVVYVINRVLVPTVDSLAPAEAATPTPTDMTVEETTTITAGEAVSDTQDPVPAPQEVSVNDGGSLLSGAGQIPAFVLLLLLLAGGVLTILRRQG